MNVAVYDPKSQRLKHLPGHPGMTPDGLREFSLFAQVAAMAEGKPLSGILVGWEDAPSPYIGIFLLGDTVDQPPSKSVLDRIERLARGQ